MTAQHRILVGVVGAPHGVRGEVRLKSYTADPLAIATYGPLASEDGSRVLTLASIRPVKDDMVVVRVDGVTTREAAAALTNTRLYVDRAVLPAAEEDEFYHADLIGLLAESDAGAPLGRVAALLNFGAEDLLEIRPDVGETLLVSFTRAFVPVVDLAAGRVVVSAAALAADEADDVPGTDEPPGSVPHP